MDWLIQIVLLCLILSMVWGHLDVGLWIQICCIADGVCVITIITIIATTITTATTTTTTTAITTLLQNLFPTPLRTTTKGVWLTEPPPPIGLISVLRVCLLNGLVTHNPQTTSY